VSGPQGPVAPAGHHQLSFFPKYEIFSTQWLFQILALSSSLGAFSSPSKTVTAIFLLSIPSQSLLVRNS